MLFTKAISRSFSTDPAGLTPKTFAPFGEVIENPTPTSPDHQSSSPRKPAFRHLQNVPANQGTATKWLDVAHLDNHYAENAPSQKKARVVFNLFDCRPRTLSLSKTGKSTSFPVRILERHPYTSQTFIPLGLSAGDVRTRYLVIVAPTLQTRQSTSSKSSLDKSSSSAEHTFYSRPRGSGLPDLARLQAFVARGDQAVTYGPGTWHAPMVVLGERPIAFVVVQYANGVAEEDCQEVGVETHDGGEGLVVDLEGVVDARDAQEGVAGAGIMRAKL